MVLSIYWVLSWRSYSSCVVGLGPRFASANVLQISWCTLHNINSCLSSRLYPPGPPRPATALNSHYYHHPAYWILSIAHFIILLLASFHLQYKLLHPKDRQLLRYKLNGVWERWRTSPTSTVLCAVISVVPAASSSLTADGRSIDTKWSFPSWEFSMTILLCGSRAGAGSGHHWASLSPHFKFVNHISGWVAMSSFYFVGMFRKKTIIRPHLTDFERMPG